MKKLALATSVAAIAVLLASFSPVQWSPGSAALDQPLSSISPSDLPVAASLETAAYSDAH